MKNSILIRELQEQRKKLSLYIRKAEARLQKAPEGTVRIVKYKKGYQYYLRTNPSDTIGVYIPVSERSKAIELIQKGYDSKIVKAAKKQQMIIDRFLKGYDPDCLKKVHSSLSEARKKASSLYFKERWKDPEYRAIQENNMQKVWNDPNSRRIRTKQITEGIHSSQSKRYLRNRTGAEGR